MPTFGQISDRIEEDFLNRTDLTDSVNRAILASVRHYQQQRFWFNETATVATASAGDRNVAIPTNLLELDLLEVTENSATYSLTEVSFKKIREFNTIGATGLPTFFAIQNDQFELSLIPNSAYSVTITYLKRFDQLSASTDTNDMLTYFEDLITYRAAKIVWGVTLRNEKEAGVCAALERDALAVAYRTRDMRALSNVEPTEF